MKAMKCKITKDSYTENQDQQEGIVSKLTVILKQ
jgi:hypothetical protein